MKFTFKEMLEIYKLVECKHTELCDNIDYYRNLLQEQEDKGEEVNTYYIDRINANIEENKTYGDILDKFTKQLF